MTPNFREFTRFTNKINNSESSLSDSLKQFLNHVEMCFSNLDSVKDLKIQIDKKDNLEIIQEFEKNLENDFIISEDKLKKFKNELRQFENLGEIEISKKYYKIHHLNKVLQSQS